MSELVLLSAPSRAALIDEIQRVIGYLDRVPDAALADIAYTCSLTHGERVLAVVVEDTQSLRLRLASARDRLASPSVERLRDRSGTYYFEHPLLGEGIGRLAFVYPGVPSFYPDMLRDIAIRFPRCRDAFDELEEAMAQDGDGFVPSAFVFPPAPCYRHDADVFSSGAYAQALVSTYAACVALTRLVMDCGLAPQGLVGFAGGDLAAMMRSGAAGKAPSRPDRIRVIRDIYAIVNKAIGHAGLPEVTMATVLTRHAGEAERVVANFPKDKVVLSVDFSPRQKTYSISPDFREVAFRAFADMGARVVTLGLNRPFNTPLCESIASAIKRFASGWVKHDPVCDVYSCATAERVPPKTRIMRRDLGERWAKPVRFEETIRRMYADGYRVFLEVGPRGLMSSAVDDTLKGMDHAAIVMNSIHRRGVFQIQHAFAQLAAYGARLDLAPFFEGRKVRKLDFDASFSVEVRREAEMRLSRAFPRLTLLAPDMRLSGATALAEPKGLGAKAAARAAAAKARQARRQRQFGFGAMSPLVSDADLIEASPAVSMEVVKTFRLSEMPFIGDFALGTSQISYSDPNLKGLISLTLPMGIEIMGELAQQLAPNRTLVAVEDLLSRRMIAFRRGELRLRIRAERVPSDRRAEVAVKVLIREDSPDSATTLPVMEATFLLAVASREGKPLQAEPLSRPRNVHWTGRDVYPTRICYGKRLRGIEFVEAWSEAGLDYTVRVPPLANNVMVTRFPVWAVNPILFGIITSGFSLWRSHERFSGAFSFPFRLRRLDLYGALPEEGAALNCYMRLTGVTPKSQICDFSVTDGNGVVVAMLSGWEEMTERVPPEYCDLILQPATTFLTEELQPGFFGEPPTAISTAFITDVPYPTFERNEELWLKTLSQIILCAEERRAFEEMGRSVARRTEWLFGRVAAKDAVRRFLRDQYQARWSDADIQVWPDDSGKPHVLGAWADMLATRLDIAITHTSRFIVAVAAANAHVGVDVESLNRDVSDDLARSAFTPDEMELAAQTTVAQPFVRMWCAKEAVSKALGIGLRHAAREIEVVSYKAETGQLALRLRGAWLETFPTLRGRDLPATVRHYREHALALSILPSNLFGDGGF